jgi:IS30 family transposase
MPGSRLSLEERIEIEVGLAGGNSWRVLSGRLGRHRSTVIREVSHNGGRDVYRATTAQSRSQECSRRPKLRRLVADPELAGLVNEGLAAKTSPAPLARQLTDQGHPVSAETIYRECYRPGSVLGDDAWTLLARRRPYRKRRRRTRTGVDPRPLGQIRLVSLRHVDLTREWGHWEGDLIVGAANRSAAVVLTERVSRYLLLGALQTRTTMEVVGVVAALLDQVPTPIRHSLCWDQGRELTAWPHLEEQFGIDVYFCSPRSPWQKPLVENTCGLLRRWLPRRSSLHRSQTEMDTIAAQLNNMPRRILQWQTAQNRYDHLVATTS